MNSLVIVSVLNLISYIFCLISYIFCLLSLLFNPAKWKYHLNIKMTNLIKLI